MRILIAYDGSDCAQAAIADLPRAGLPLVCDVTVLCAADVWLPKEQSVALPPDSRDIPTIASLRAQAQEAVDAAAAQADSARAQILERFPRWNVRLEAVADSPAWAIVKRADEWPADLVVIGSHGRGALGRVMMGSVSLRVLDELKRPVRVARPPRNRDSLRLIVAVDGSPDAESAVATVAERHWPPGTEVRILTAMNWQLLAAPVPIGAGQAVPEPNRAEQSAGRAVQRLAQKGLVVVRSIRTGDAKTAIIDEAQTWEADCVFLGARGLTRSERWLMGSVSTAVAMRAPCSVEVVPRPTS